MPTGSCICGDISYSFSEEPQSKVLCHCLLCRKLTGTAFLTGLTLTDPEQVQPNGSHNTVDVKAATHTAGFTWKSKSDSQLKVSTGQHECGLTMTFSGCNKCPSTLFKTCKEGFPGVLILLAGNVDGEYEGPEFGAPQAELWVQHRLPWLKEIENAKQCQTFT